MLWCKGSKGVEATFRESLRLQCITNRVVCIAVVPKMITDFITVSME